MRLHDRCGTAARFLLGPKANGADWLAVPERAKIFTMLRRSHFRTGVFLAGLLLAVSPLSLSARQDRRGRKYKIPPPASNITVTVVRNDDGKPIANAAVIFHPIEGDRDKGGLELKSDADGKANIDVIPIGDTVRLQIIANGYQTYGGDYKVSKAQMAMHIKLKRPGQQYSIYDNHEPDEDSGSGSGAEKSGNSSKDGSNSKSSSSGKQDAQSGQAPPDSQQN